MDWTALHGTVLSQAFSKILGQAETGAMAFVRCLTSDVVFLLATDANFSISNWNIWRVADNNNPEERTIEADRAVELRENKGTAVLLLVDTLNAGAGMDGIYSAAREITESTLFKEAISIASRNITKTYSRNKRLYVEKAIKKAAGHGNRLSISLWNQFDFLVKVAANDAPVGSMLCFLGLWPVNESLSKDEIAELDTSKMFVDKLLGSGSSQSPPKKRIQSLKLDNPNEDQLRELETFLWESATKPILSSLNELRNKPLLWINNLSIEGSSQSIKSFTILPWRNKTGNIFKWSGLVDGKTPQYPPNFILKPDAENTGEYSNIEIRWKTEPSNLKKGAVEYRIEIVTDMDEEITSKEILHSAKKEEKCKFNNDDFITLSEDAQVNAKIMISVVGSDTVEPQETEEFCIRMGQPPTQESGGIGKKVRAFCEGAIELEDRSFMTDILYNKDLLRSDAKGFIHLRISQLNKSFRVFQPPMIRDLEQKWYENKGLIGRWRIKIRASGETSNSLEFIPFECPTLVNKSNWDRASNACRRFVDHIENNGGSAAQIYDEENDFFTNIIKEYLLAWSNLLEEGNSLMALANTLEIQALSGRTIGIIVLPTHPLRVSWHAGYDNLLLYAAFQEKKDPKEIRKEMAFLDGAMFPALLPGLDNGSSFVFGDMLGFYAVGMVLDTDEEPKSSLALMARALGKDDVADTLPMIGKESATILANEIEKYLSCHVKPKLFHIHALRPGDGLTVCRALSIVNHNFSNNNYPDPDEQMDTTNHIDKGLSFVLELYPSENQQDITGRFISETREKKRRRSDNIPENDRWMLESLSLPGNITIPRLRWARKQHQIPESPAHITIAFDTFDSQVICEETPNPPPKTPYFVYGMLSFFEKSYISLPEPTWKSYVPIPSEGQKHPSDRTHTERLGRLHQAVLKCVTNNFNEDAAIPILVTSISDEKNEQFDKLHSLSDWVITLDRNIGIEYFDSPKDHNKIYDSYVIECLPEREDLGCLQLITSTRNLDEVRSLLDRSLAQMGLNQSRRNTLLLLEHIKALSGKLALQLTGQKRPPSELIALAMSHANCAELNESENDPCWISLKNGFFIPADDVQELLARIIENKKNNEPTMNGPNLIYVSLQSSKKGLVFSFIGAKYCRHLRSARNPHELKLLNDQITSFRTRWDAWYLSDGERCSFISIRRAKLARIIKFYADRAYRHRLSKDNYERIVAETIKMVEQGEKYTFPESNNIDRGWIFCPEYTNFQPLEISPIEWQTKCFLFGPSLLPDLDIKNKIETYTTKPDEDKKPIGTSVVENQTKKPEKMDFPQPFLYSGHSIPPAVSFGKDIITGSNITLDLKVQGNPHLLIAGLPGMGKTTCLLNLSKQIQANGICPIIFSYHQDIDDKIEEVIKPVRYIDFNGLGFNPLQVIDRTNPSAYLDIAATIRDIFMAIYPELGDIQGESIRSAIKESFLEAGWGHKKKIAEAHEEPAFKTFFEKLKSNPKPDRGLTTLLARLEELNDYGFFEMAENQQNLWESKAPVVIRIHKTQNDSLQKAFASLILFSLYKDMFRRGLKNSITHVVIFDEAHRAAGLNLIPTMTKECRKYGIAMIVASQEAKDFNISLFSAVANYLVLRLTENDAKALVKNVASSQQERLLIDKIKQMDRFKALYFCEGKIKPANVALTP
jgi:DNA phosphorothioation-dependent restriction protein DptH